MGQAFQPTLTGRGRVLVGFPVLKTCPERSQTAPGSFQAALAGRARNSNRIHAFPFWERPRTDILANTMFHVEHCCVFARGRRRPGRRKEN